MDKPQRILVTGGAGVVGSALITELRRRGHHVVVADVMHGPWPDYVRCDVADFRQLEQIWTGGGWRAGYSGDPRTFDLVFHLGAEFGRWNGEDYYEDVWRTNAIGTKNVLRMQEREGFRAVYFSSSEVYGDYDGVMAENVMDTVEIRQMNDYALSKWVNELQVMNSAEQAGTSSVRVRLFNTYGPGEWYSPYRSVIAMFCYRLLHGQPITVYRGHTRTSTYIDDCVRALANLTDRFVPGEVYNIAGDEHHTIEEAATLAAEAAGRKEQFDDLVRFADAEPHTTMHKVADNAKARAALDMRTTVGLTEGIGRTVDWMRQAYRPSGAP